MSAVPDCFTLQDVKTGRFVFISPGYEGIFKRPLRALEANPFDWLSVVHPEDRAGLREHFLNASAAPTTRVAQEFRVVDPDRSLRWVRVTWMPIRSSEGNPAHRAAIIQDVTDEHQLRILREDAATKDKALAVARQTATFKAQFLNMAAHDLATPITPLRLQVAAMRSRALFANDAVALDSIDLLDRNLLRLTGLIQDVLHVARIEMKAAPVDLREIVRGATGLLQVQADAGKVTLDVNTDPGPMTGDPDRLGQIVLNLLSNAVKFTPPGGHVKVHLSAKDGKASLAVMDDGRGISQADLAKLFEPFRRVGDLSKAPGTGLGLYISRGLAKRMGGDITAASAGEGKGATFTLTVPLTPPTVPAA